MQNTELRSGPGEVGDSLWEEQEGGGRRVEIEGSAAA